MSRERQAKSMTTTIRHWLGTKKYALNQTIRALAYRTQTPFGKRVVNHFWEEQATVIHEQWGADDHDFAVLAAIFATHQPTSILDVGCGSGRLFHHYRQHGIHDIVGTDISATALAIANERHPTVPTLVATVEELDFPAHRFDLAICNRVLQHIPRQAIDGAIGKLCSISKRVYVNELTESDQLAEEFFMFRHDYPTLFARHGLHLQQRGHIAPAKRGAGNSQQQTYYLYGQP